MKTRNNVQKAISKFLAVVISLVLISITVNAQDFWKSVMENNSFGQIAMAMATETKNSPTEITASSLTGVKTNVIAEETDNALELENWMLNESNFFTTFAEDAEETLELEAWMTNEAIFSTNTFFVEEAEEALQIEEWMLNENNFEVNNYQAEAEGVLKLEGWMTNAELWEM